MPRRGFFEKSLRALSSLNQTWDGVGSEGEEEEDDLERRRFQDGVDLRLGAIEQTNAKKRKGEREIRKKVPNKSI